MLCQKAFRRTVVISLPISLTKTARNILVNFEASFSFPYKIPKTIYTLG